MEGLLAVPFLYGVLKVAGGVFVSLLPQEMPLWAMLVLPPLIFCIEAGWHSIVDRAAGGVLGLLGLKLIHDAGH